MLPYVYLKITETDLSFKLDVSDLTHVLHRTYAARDSQRKRVEHEFIFVTFVRMILMRMKMDDDSKQNDRRMIA